MTISMYQASVPAFQKQLSTLKTILKKAEEHAAANKIEPATLLTARLYPDMFHLTRQVQIAGDVAKGAVSRLSGREIPSYPDTESTFAELYARIDKTLEYIASIPASEIDGKEEADITITPAGRTLQFKGQAYLVHWAMPNFYFHVMTTYAILRENGVPVGKMDYLGF